jgi:hypothetical protein
MRGFHRFRDLLAQLREQFGKDAISGKPLPVLGFEEFFPNDSAGVDKEISRPGKTFLHPGGFGVKDPVSPYGFRAGVREHGIFDLVAIGEEFQNFLGIIADGCQLDALLFEPWDGALQLDQLPFAEGSPVGRTEKEKNGAVRPLEGIESLWTAKLVMN